MVSLSLIISFYKNTAFLEKVAASLTQQTFREFEIILADDGSDDRSSQEALSYLRATGLDLHHVWQEDTGFRKTRILNRAVVASNSGYLVFIDGDCVLHPRFLEDHFDRRRNGAILSGRRVMLSGASSRYMTVERLHKGAWGQLYAAMLLDTIAGRTKGLERGFRIPWRWFNTEIQRKDAGIIGCNMSLHKSDLLLVNGFDERYDGPGHGEDSDLQVRLARIGVHHEPLFNYAVQFHLDHPFQPRPSKVGELFEAAKQSGTSWTPYGITQDKP